MNALERAKLFFFKGELTAEVRGPSSTKLRNSLRCLVGVALAATVCAAFSVAAAQSKSPKVAATLSPLEHGIAVAKAIPAPWAKKIIWTSFNGGPDGPETKANLIFNKLDFATRCEVAFNTSKSSQGAMLGLRMPGLTPELYAEFLMLHEISHCYARVDEVGRRPDFTSPNGYVKTQLLKIPLEALVTTLAGEAAADVSAVIWMAKRYPEQRNKIVKAVKQGRQLSHDVEGEGGGADDHYTVAALDNIGPKLAKMSNQELARITADEIQVLAEMASLQTVKNYRQSITPLRLMVAEGIPDALQVHLVTFQGGKQTTEMVRALSGKGQEKSALFVEIKDLPSMVVAAALPKDFRVRVMPEKLR